MKAVNVTLRRSIAAAVVVLAAPVLSSCGSNFNAPTDKVYNPGIGVNDRSGDVDVLHALVVTGEDGSGTVVAALVNKNPRRADRLSNVAGAGADQGVGLHSTGRQVVIPPDSLYQLADKGTISVTGSQIQPGHFVELTFSFQHASSVTMQVPVVSNTEEDFSGVPVPIPLPSPSSS